MPSRDTAARMGRGLQSPRRAFPRGDSEEDGLGCLVRTVGAILVLIVLLVGLRRVLESPASVPPPAPGERDLYLDGVRWRSREAAGQGSLEPVVYVHGFLSSSATWKRSLVQASAARLAIAVDLPGAGYSDRPWPYDYTVYGQAEHLLQYLDARGISRVILVGSSLGGAICEVAAAARPDRVAGLVLVDAASPQTNVPLGFRMLRAPLLGDLQIEFLVRPVMEYTLRHRLYARADQVTEETVDDWWRPVTVPGTRRAALAAVRTDPKTGAGLLDRIRTPTLVLWGQEDALLPAAEGLALSQKIEGARFVAIPRAGHLPQEETPPEFARAVSGFLQELEANRTLR